MSSIYLIFCLLLAVQTTQTLKCNFKKIACNVTGPEPANIKFEKCLLKAVARNQQFFTIKLKLLHKPVNNIKIHLKFVKRANGWRPFLYDLTFKCGYETSTNSVLKLVWKHVKALTNINQSCPLNGDLEAHNVKNTYVGEKLFPNLPVPPGEYGVLIRITFDQQSEALVEVYGTIFY